MEPEQGTIKQHAEELRGALTKLKISVETKQSNVAPEILTEIHWGFSKLWACIIEQEGQAGGQMYPASGIMQ